MPFLGGGHGQSETAMAAWEHILAKYDFARIVELGTWNGNFSVYFALWCERRGADFHTYDIEDWRDVDDMSKVPDDPTFRARYLDGHFSQLDVMKQPGLDEVRDVIARPGMTVLFCDNGNKPHEFLNYAPYLKLKDMIAMHDWEHEMSPSAVARAEREYDCLFDHVYTDDTFPQTAFFVRVK